MEPVRRLVVDVLKPHDSPLLEFTRQVAGRGRAACDRCEEVRDFFSSTTID